MEIIFFGTSSGTPTKTRNVSGTGIKYADSKQWILVDCGEGTQHQILHSPLSIMQLQAICITHVHGDHCYGLPGLLGSAAMLGRKKPMWILCPKNIQAMLEAIIELTDIYLPYDIRYIHLEDNKLIQDQFIFDIEVVELSHRVACYGFVFTEKVKQEKLDVEKLRADKIPDGPIWGELHREGQVTLDDGRVIQLQDYQLAPTEPRKVIIAGDNDKPACFESVITNVSVLVHESTYTQDVLDKVGDKPQHSSAKMVAEFAQTHQLPNLVLMHFSPRYHREVGEGQSLQDIRDEAETVYDGNVVLAKDLGCYRLSKDGKLRECDYKSYDIGC